MKLLVSVICCDYKAYSLEQCINAIRESDLQNYKLLLNFEGYFHPTSYSSLFPKIQPKINFLHNWSENKSWEVDRQKDQDQYFRLPKICTARNMCVDFAIANDFDWILFVDSDVLIPPDTYARLFPIPDVRWEYLRGGLVPGRGIHQTFNYTTKPCNREFQGWEEFAYGTMGFVAIENVFCLCQENWWINMKCIAQHVDHPERPLDFNNVAEY